MLIDTLSFLGFLNSSGGVAGAALNVAASGAPNWFERIMFESWQSSPSLTKLFGLDIFSRDGWRGIMTGTAIGLSIITAVFFVLERRYRFLTTDPIVRSRNLKWWRAMGLALAAVGALTYFDFFNPNVRYVQYYHRHELFHYYVGSKYFQELGYGRLYECTAVAQTELSPALEKKMREGSIRDLRGENLIKPLVETDVFKDPTQCTKHFSPERWTAFKNDISWFERNARGDYWDNMIKDHGYNPPPVWTMEGKFFGSFGSADDGFFKRLAVIDVGLHFGVLGMLWWAFGWRVMMVASVFWGCNTPANFYWTGGAFIRQDWIFFFVSSVCLARKRFHALAGASLMWAALLRIFPLIAFFGWGAMVVIHWARKRKLHPDQKRIILGAICAVLVLVPTSMAVTAPSAAECAERNGGELGLSERAQCFASPYLAFAEHISLHKDTPLTNHMGLETILVHTWDGRMRFAQDNSYDDAFEPWKAGRAERKHNRRPLQLLIIASVAFGIFWALRRTKLTWVAVGLSVPLIISLVNLTCYYYCAFLAAVPLIRSRPVLAPVFLATTAGSHILLHQIYYIDDRYTALSYLFYLLGVLILFAYCRPVSKQRLLAWWRGRPEPKAKFFADPPRTDP